MSKTKLLFDLIMFVNTKRSFTAQDVADEFQVSIRTARRYLMEISELGVPMFTEQGRGGGYRVLKNRVLPPILFEENEALAIFFAFRSLAFYESLPFETDIESASRKLFVRLPEDIQRQIHKLESVLAFWNPQRGVSSPYLKEILMASMENSLLRITYQSQTGNTQREIVPIGIYANDGLWYMPACEVRQDRVRLFRVDRIASLQITGITHEMNIKLLDWLRSYPVASPVRLQVVLTREGLRQCQSQPWFHPQELNHEAGTATLDTIIDENDIGFMASFFAKLGTEAKVLEPERMIDRIRNHALLLLSHYS